MGWVSAIFVAHFARGANRLGVTFPEPSILGQLGREPVLTDRVGIGELLDLIEALYARSGRRDIPLLVAQRIEEHDSPLFHLVAASVGAREGLDALVQYAPLLSDCFCYRKQVNNDDVQISLQRTAAAPPRLGMDMLLEFELAAVALACRFIFPPTGIPCEEIWLRAPDGPVDAFESLSRCPVRAGMPTTQVRLSARNLGARPIAPNAILAGFLERQLAGFLERLPPAAPTAVERVREYLHRAVRIDPGASTCAAALGMSERTLSRRLAEEGTHFHKELDAVRCELARAWLLVLPLHEIAERLGYSEESAFRRAFRRWTGSAPSTLRRTLAKRPSTGDER